jgi:putative oxidoreductase
MPAPEDDDVTLLHPAIAATGRGLFSLIFFLSGATHFTNLQQYVALMPAAIPFRPFWVMISAVVEILGATLIAINRYPRLGG